MLYELAIEPTLLNRCDRAVHILDKFGVSKGRLIADFPNGGWESMVLQSSVSCGQVERHRIKELLLQARRHLVSFERSYIKGVPWLPNAEGQQLTKPFHLIIADQNPNSRQHIVTEADLNDGVQRWIVDRERCVPRSPEELARAVSMLLKISREILFIDPYFSPEMPRYQRTLQHFVRAATDGGRTLARLEFHLDAEKHNNAAWFAAECQTQLAALLPRGIPLQVIRWRERPHGEELHARYILTERGGVRVERGLDCGLATQTTDLTLLDLALYQQRWANYQRSSAAFDFVDQTTVTGTAST